jgi:hypothetical protein
LVDLRAVFLAAFFVDFFAFLAVFLPAFLADLRAPQAFLAVDDLRAVFFAAFLAFLGRATRLAVVPARVDARLGALRAFFVVLAALARLGALRAAAFFAVFFAVVAGLVAAFLAAFFAVFFRFVVDFFAGAMKDLPTPDFLIGK